MRNVSAAKPRQESSLGYTPWRERPYLTMQAAEELAGISRGSLYGLASEGRLVLKRLAGRTLVDVASFKKLVDAAEPWTPSDRGAAGRAARAPRAAQARA